MVNPSCDTYVNAYMRYSLAVARNRWEIEFGQPQRARKTARAWVGIIRLSTMGSIAGYTNGFWEQPYEPPVVGVAPAAPEMHSNVERFNTTFLPAGTVYHYLNAHEGIVAFQLGIVGARNEIIGKPQDWERRCNVHLEDDRVLLTWDKLATEFSDPNCPQPPYFRLLRVDGEQEHHIERLSSSIVRVFPTQGAARIWAKTRAAELKAQHDRNHASQCRDKACAKRRHIYVHGLNY